LLYLKALIESVRTGPFAGSILDETTSHGVHPEQQKAFLLPCDNISRNFQNLHRSPKLIFYPDPACHLNEIQLEDAAEKALQLYSWDDSFGPADVCRCPALVCLQLVAF
jgi:hypothetical protein